MSIPLFKYRAAITLLDSNDTVDVRFVSCGDIGDFDFMYDLYDAVFEKYETEYIKIETIQKISA